MTLRSILAILGLGAKPTQTGLRVLTGVSATLNATHRRRERGDVHPHTWDITVWVNPIGQVNAVHLRDDLNKWLSKFEGKCLPDNLAWAEDLAIAVAQGMTPDPSGYDGWLGEVIAVDIRRDAERLLARIERLRTHPNTEGNHE